MEVTKINSNTSEVLIKPSGSNVTKNSPITFLIELSDSIVESSINVVPDRVIVEGTAGQFCRIDSITRNDRVVAVTLGGCSGTGYVGISLMAGSVKNKAGNFLGKISSSSYHYIDESGPMAPAMLSMSESSDALIEVPAISYSSPNDLGESGVERFEIQLVRQFDELIVQDWIDHVSGAGLGSIELAPNTSYSIRVRAVDRLGNIGDPSAPLVYTTADRCPINFIKVPATTGYTNKDFCVAKYEMKNILGHAAATHVGAPWVSISRTNSIEKCRGLYAGAGDNPYDLITNSEWQSIVRNIEQTKVNWSGGDLGVGMINRGHADNAPQANLAASSDDGEACFGTNNVNCMTLLNSDFEQKRTHVLSNGEIIWDLGGNVREWVKSDNVTNFGNNIAVSLLTATSHPTAGIVDQLEATAKIHFGTQNSYIHLSTGERGGLGTALLQYNAGAIVRGGWRWDFNDAGIFSTYLNYAATYSDTFIGFRCSYQLQN